MKKILVVNDCKFESIIIKDMLNSIGYEVKITNEDKAISDFESYKPYFIIANLIMKNTKGNILIKKIKSMSPDVICILSSCDNIKLSDYKSFMVDDVITTPVKLDKMKQTLTNIQSRDLPEKESGRNYDFCPFCGHRFEESLRHFKFCPYCGENIA